MLKRWTVRADGRLKFERIERTPGAPHFTLFKDKTDPEIVEFMSHVRGGAMPHLRIKGVSDPEASRRGYEIRQRAALHVRPKG